MDERTLRAITSFILLYVGLFVLGAAVIAIDTAIQGPSITVLDAIAASATTLGNVGPGGGANGPMGSFEPYSDIATTTMTGLTWLGRLEVIPHHPAGDAPLLAHLVRRLATSHRLLRIR